MFKRLLCITSLLLLLAFPQSICAAGSADFALSDVTTNKNRSFETTLSVTSEVSAFVAEIEYDPQLLKFTNLINIDKNAYRQFNTEQEGRIIIAYLHEEGISGDLLKLKFTSRDESCNISLSVYDVIDSKGEDVTINKQTGAEVLVNSSGSEADKKNKQSDNKTSSDYSDADVLSYDKNSSTSDESGINKINLAAEDEQNLLIIVITGATLVIIFVGAIAFMLGKKSGNNKKN